MARYSPSPKPDNHLEENLVAINDNLNEVLGAFDPLLSQENPLSSLRLSETHYNSLYEQARIFQNMVNLIPEDSNLEYPLVQTLGDFNPKDLQKDLEAIPAYGEPLEQIDLKGAVTLAGIYSRLYGDGFIFMGFRDGKDPSEPLDWDAVEGIDWVFVRSKYEVSINTLRETITNHGSGYNAASVLGNTDKSSSLRGIPFHYTRVYRMTGVSRHGTSLHSDHFNLSVIDGVYNDYTRYLQAVTNSANMLASHSTFKFAMSGLSAKVTKSSLVVALRRRLENIMSGIQILGGVLYDKDNEDAEYVDRSYSGVNDILQHLKDWMVGNSGLPMNKLFGSAAASSLSSQSEGEEKQWAEIIERYRSSQVLPFYRLVLKAILLEQNVDPDTVMIEFESFNKMTDKEKAETELVQISARRAKLDLFMVAVEAELIPASKVSELLEEWSD